MSISTQWKYHFRSANGKVCCLSDHMDHLCAKCAAKVRLPAAATTRILTETEKADILAMIESERDAQSIPKPRTLSSLFRNEQNPRSTTPGIPRPRALSELFRAKEAALHSPSGTEIPPPRSLSSIFRK